MFRRRQFLAVAGGIAVAGCSGGSDEETTEPDGETTAAGDEPTEGDGETPTDESGDGGDSLAVSTPAFDDGGTIPEKYTGVGEDVSPTITVESVPAEAETLAVILDDPDANNYVHWLLWNVPGDVEEIPEGLPQEQTLSSLDGAKQGTNDMNEVGYRGPLPPSDDGLHTYRFAVSAVDTTLDLEAGVGRGKLEDALDGHVVDTDSFTGEFER